ncbi:hypothetical protein BMETH_37501832093, partial [methanotrophic bacterial endosymbiont of Bathymodiolus sp.]
EEYKFEKVFPTPVGVFLWHTPLISDA